MKRTFWFVALAAAAVVSLADVARADSIAFQRRSSNATDDLSSQIGLDVTFNSGAGTVTFTFTNDVGVASSICDVYFRSTLATYLDSDSLSLTQTGVSFSNPASPNSPPSSWGWGGVLSEFQIDSNPPPAPNGINSATDSLGITFDLIVGSGDTFAGVQSALLAALLGGDNIGLHVQAIGTSGQSDWYSNTTVPEPASLVLLGAGIAGLATRRIRRRRGQAAA